MRFDIFIFDIYGGKIDTSYQINIRLYVYTQHVYTKNYVEKNNKRIYIFENEKHKSIYSVWKCFYGRKNISP